LILKKENPNDKHIDAIYNYLVKELVYSKNFKLDKYSSKNFSDAANEFLQNKTNASKKEVETNENEAKPKNKYDKIKTKKNKSNKNGLQKCCKKCKSNTDKTPEGEVLDSLHLNKMCCRRHMLTHVDIE